MTFKFKVQNSKFKIELNLTKSYWAYWAYRAYWAYYDRPNKPNKQEGD